MKNTFKIVSPAVLAVAFAVMSASAEDRHWQGGADAGTNNWNLAANWKEGYIPSYSDIAIFDPGEGVDLLVTNKLSASPWYSQAKGIRVLSGNVTLASRRAWACNSTTGELFVAEGATMTFQCQVATIAEKALVKSGLGTVDFKNSIGYSGDGGARPYHPFILEEGVAIARDVFYGDLVVRPGAEWRVTTYNVFGSNTGIVTVDKDGAVVFLGDGSQSMSGLEGAGTVKFTGSVSTAKLTLRMAGQDCTFAGTISSGITVTIPNTATKRFIVASSNALASVSEFNTSKSALQFAPGISDYWVKNLAGVSSGYGVFPTSDTDGNPITVHATLASSGNNASAQGTGDLVVGNTWDRTGSSTFTVGTNTLMRGERTTSMNSVQTEFTRPRDSGVSASFTGSSAVLDINGGSFLAGASSSQLNTIKVRNGGSFTAMKNLTAKNDKTIYVDGATLNQSFASGNERDFGSDSYPWKVKVGAAGATFGVDYVSGYSSSRKLNFYQAADTDSAVTTDGGAVYDLPAIVQLYRAQNLKGPVVLRSGFWVVNASAYKNGAGSAVTTALGQGDLELGTIRLALNARDASRVTPLAGGTGAKLTLSGATRMTLKYDSSYVAQSAVIGPAGGTDCPIVSKNGGVLFLRALSASSFDGSSDCGQVKVNGAVPVDSAGRVTLPIFTQDGSTIDFAAYDAEKGFVAFANYTPFAEGEASSVALVDFATDASVTVSEDKQIAALKVVADANGNKTFTIASGKTLSVGAGDSDAPACVVLKPAGQYGNASILGSSGTLDFGARQAVFAIGRGTSYAHAPTIAAKIKTTGGVVYATPVLDTTYPWMAVSGANDYTGGTFVNGIQVRPDSDTAFGRDLVRIGDGELDGGQVCFSSARTITNAFSICGNGIKWATYSQDRGALWFCAATTLTGPVEIRRRARISACTGDYIANGGTGTFKGVISGGALQLMKGTFPIVFEAANTYTGGTEIVSSTLVLKGAGTAGTGKVTLDSGVLRFENTEPVVFANALDGVGTIEVAGTAPVTFAGRGFENLKFRTLAPGSTVDYPNCASATYVIGGEDFDIDLKGEDVTVAGVSGSGTIRGGVMTVTGSINPAGAGVIGTVAFETAPVLTGVTLVIETEEGAVDKVVVPGDADISTLNLEIVQLGDIVEFKPSAIFACGGDLTGEFASVTKPTQKGKNYTVEYTASAATLSYTTPGALILVR